MPHAGIDIGSRTIELIVLEGNDILVSKREYTGYDPINRAKDILEDAQFDRIMATGYSRHLFGQTFGAPTVTEIKAYAKGAKSLYPSSRTILDIGGQDSKVIALNGKGNVVKFEMNDRCAAGTGKFLEIMADTLGYDLEEFGIDALKSLKDIQINSTCTVFAESEVTSLVAKGQSRQDIALALHKSVVKRSVGMLKRISTEEPIIFAGGVARNPCICRLLEDGIGKKIQVPDNPQMVGALGAALLIGELQ